MSHTIRLRSGEAVADIALHGAELRAWSVAGRALIWSPDPAVWADTAPILFPVVGWTRDGSVRVDGQSYPLGLHGFARAMRFRIAAQEADWACLMLDASDESRTVFPFDFSLAVTFRLTADALRTELTIHNTGTGAMPYACGLHPGFCWPFAGGTPEDYAIDFAESEASTVPMIAPDGLFTRQRRRVPIDGPRLALSEALFAREALCFLEAKSRSLRFAHRDDAAITVTLEDFPHIALWARPGGRFLSIEAWTGHGDMEDSDGDLWKKPSMIQLEAGTTRRHAATYAFTPG
ncbi:aldose 1-epimerase family protein [Beijerinckia sp. L45]|uniref:aldose 1-epimerase family protein n=1 Tax=Beijerinckia sp. L45 TaxID=1641855 RepID=UPI00131D1306|nr:aldose 1-epimerase family protein [Beijerinckia sp. L45]